jgi:phytoene synthase
MRAATEGLAASYAACERLTRTHGTTYYWSTRLLPADKRPHVYALYALCRHADDLVDDIDPGERATPRAAEALAGFRDRLFVDLDRGCSGHPVLAAVVDTTRTFDIDPDCYRRFFRSMAMDLTVSRYERYTDLLDYTDGSAAVIGEMMLPVLEPTERAALGPARDLGVAFQLTNFLRDVDEDLDRGRVYLPQEDLRRFGADPWSRRVTPEWRALMRFEIGRTRELYRSADLGLRYLRGRSARCIGAARSLYAGILDRIEASDYDVFSGRARVSTARKLATVTASLVQPAPTGARPKGSRSVVDARRRNARGTTGSKKP